MGQPGNLSFRRITKKRKILDTTKEGEILDTSVRLIERKKFFRRTPHFL